MTGIKLSNFKSKLVKSNISEIQKIVLKAANIKMLGYTEKKRTECVKSLKVQNEIKNVLRLISKRLVFYY